MTVMSRCSWERSSRHQGLRLRMLEVGMSHPCRDGIARHERFLRNNEFDIAETSLSSHVIATSRGAPFVGIPVFPRRLFSQNHMFVNVSAGIDTAAATSSASGC